MFVPSPKKIFNAILAQIFPLKKQNLSVYQLGNPTLRKIAEPIADVRHPLIQQLIDEMLITLEESKGVGLAAPQIGRSLQLVIIASRPNERYPNAPLMEATVMINPQMISHSSETKKD